MGLVKHPSFRYIMEEELISVVVSEYSGKPACQLFQYPEREGGCKISRVYYMFHPSFTEKLNSLPYLDHIVMSVRDYPYDHVNFLSVPLQSATNSSYVTCKAHHYITSINVS